MAGETDLRTTVGQVGRQLAEAERLLDSAHEQRKELAARLKQAERDLRTAQQGEHAEARRRTELEEDVGAVRREAEEHLTALQGALATSEQRVQELEDELQRTQRVAAELQHTVAAARARGVAVAPGDREGTRERLTTELAARLEDLRQIEGRLASGREELDARRGGLESRLRDSEGVAVDLEQQLVVEREERIRSARVLADERERATAETTLLQHELDRRLRVQEAVAAQLVELRDELERTQSRVESDERRRTLAEKVLEELGTTALQLRGQLDALDEERADLERQLRDAQALVAERDGRLEEQSATLVAGERSLAGLQLELGDATVALRAATADTALHKDRLDAADRALSLAEQRARDLAGLLEGERRERRQVEGELHVRLAEERDAFATTLDEHRKHFEAAIAGERAAFEQHATTVRDGVVALRGRLAAAEADITARLHDERAAREDAERRADADREARATALAELHAQRHDADGVHAQRNAELSALRDRVVEAERNLADVQSVAARAQAAADVAIEAARVHFAQNLAAAAQRAERAESERDGLVAELEVLEPDDGVQGALVRLRSELVHVRAETADRAAREAQLESLVSQLIASAAALKDGFARELEATAAERDVQLAAEREHFSAQLVAVELRVTEMREYLASAGSELGRQLAAERAARMAAEAQLKQVRGLAAAGGGPDPMDPEEVSRLQGQLTAEQQTASRAEERIVELEDELERARVALRPPLPPADHPALRATTPAPPHAPSAGGEGDPGSVIIDLARAAARLRLRREDAVTGPPAGPAEVPAPATDQAASEVVGATPDAAPAGVNPLSAVPDAERALQQAAAPTGSAETADVRQEPREHSEVEIGPRSDTDEAHHAQAWLTAALVAEAGRDGVTAAQLLQALVPVQASRLCRDLKYDLAVADRPTVRVVLRKDGTSVVSPAPSTDEDAADFRLAGSAGALAPLFGGGLGRRLPDGIAVTGRRRRARRLIRSMRPPVELSTVAATGVNLSTVQLLTLLASAIDPAATAGERFTVTFGDSDGAVRAHVVVADTLPVGVLPGAPVHAAAGVRTEPGSLAAFLAGNASARVSGDVSVVGRLLAWADAAQGFDA